MAFIRRKGNAYYLVHNIRRDGKVKQIHLARLGERPRITDDVVREVSRNHPVLDLDWSRLRERANSRVDLFNPDSEYVQTLVQALRDLNLDLADLAPPLLKVGSSPGANHELVGLLRLLRSTVEIKLHQFDQARPMGLPSERRFR